MSINDLLPLKTEKTFDQLIPKLNEIFDAIMGRTEEETGQTVAELRAEVMEAIAGLRVYDHTAHFRGQPEAGEIIYYSIAARRHSFAQDFNGSQAKCVVAPTGEVVLDVYRNDSVVGNITFSAGVRTGVFSSIGSFTLAIGDILSVKAPDPADATFETLVFTLKSNWSE